VEPEFELQQERDGLRADVGCRDRRLAGNALDDAFVEAMAALVSDEVRNLTAPASDARSLRCSGWFLLSANVSKAASRQ